MKRIAVLGSSGSIGTTTLKIISQYKKEFRLEALTVNRNIGRLRQQIRRFKPRKIVVVDKDLSRCLNKEIGPAIDVYCGTEGLERIASDKDIDLVVIALSGSAALLPLLAAIREGKQIALANKEALVMAGGIITQRLKASGARLIPVDSEQSAIFQCLESQDKQQLRRLYLTASGGALYDLPQERFRGIKVEQILRHPRWKMGKKITVDSATLMNKGLEVIEAGWLFGVEVSDIQVLIHRQAVVHSMVEFIDGVVLAQLGITDMALPVQYALSYPRRLFNDRYRLDFLKIGNLTFERPDTKKFPCLDFAYQAASDGGSAPCAMNAANEEAVCAFLEKRIAFIAIPEMIEKIMSRHRVIHNQSLEEILETDRRVRLETRAVISRLKVQSKIK